MPYQEGDTSPPHVQVHNEVRAQVSELANLMSVTVDLPPVVGLGDSGHVDHHNQFTTAINKIAAEGSPPPAESYPVGNILAGETANQGASQLVVKKKDGTRMMRTSYQGTQATQVSA